MAVLWAVLLLSVMAMSLSVSTRTGARVEANLTLQAEARALADAGVQRALFTLLDPVEERRWRTDGTAYEFFLGSGAVSVEIEDEGGKIDLNAAAGDLLRALFLSAGLAAAQAQGLSDMVLDWRDANDVPRPQGAEIEEYRAAGLTYGPANRAFERMDELRLLPGVTPDLYERLRSAITVYSHQPGIDVRAASREALAALPGLSPDDVRVLLAQRDDPAAFARSPQLMSIRRHITRSAEVTFTIRSQGSVGNSAVFVRRAVVRLTRNPARPFHLLEWGQDRRRHETPAFG